MNAIGKVLALGCGTTLQKVLRSKRHATLQKANKALEVRHSSSTDAGVALRAGHMEFGRLINTVGERQALVGAKGITPSFGTGMELRPLIQATGEHIIRAAKKCLTPTIKNMAKKWNGCTADEQVEICRSLYQTLLSNGQKSHGEMTTDGVLQSIERNMRANAHEVKKVLPQQYGVWNPDSCIANCQGKTQMIVAFARLAKARVITAQPLLNAGAIMHGIRSYVHERTMEDIHRRNITYLDESFSESIRAYSVDRMYRIDNEFFHVCACIEVADGRWVMIDPHALNFGVFPKEWDIPSIADKLDRYSEVLPGLHLSATDRGAHEKLHTIVETRVNELLARSLELEKIINGCRHPMELSKTLENSPELLFILEKMAGWDEETIDKYRQNPGMREMAAMLMAFGKDALDFVGMFAAMQGEQFMMERKHVLITAYHAIAMNEHMNQWTEDGTLIHPKCEFSNPEYTVAISAINSLVDTYSSDVNRFFMDYSFDQTSMFNALAELLPYRWGNRERNEEIGMAAFQSLKALPIRHPLCSRKMSLCKR